jgi:hypothetical protein
MQGNRSASLATLARLMMGGLSIKNRPPQVTAPFSLNNSRMEPFQIGYSPKEKVDIGIPW